jgi:hypothetical protein
MRTLAVSLVGVLALLARVHAQVDPPSGELQPGMLGPPFPEEFYGDAYLPAPSPARLGPTAEHIDAGLATTTQVNVSPSGMNILDDAANEPSMAVDPTAPNRIAIGWRQFDNIASNFRQGGYAWSNDGGRSWNFDGVFRSDPVLDYDSDGTFYYNSLLGSFDTDVWTSVDGGRTWSNPTPSFGGDKNWIAVDRTSGIGRDHLYEIWKFDITRSIDRNASYQSPIPLPLGLQRGTVTVGPDGEVYVGGQATGSSIGIARSDQMRDPAQGLAFNHMTAVSLGGSYVARDAPNPGGLPGQVWVAVDHSARPSRGHVYLLCSVRPSGDPMDVMIARSRDQGVTWDPPVRVNDDPMGSGRYQWFGTMSVAPNGRVDVVWNDTRASLSATLCELYYAFSTDGGQTWSPNERISAQWNSVIGWPNQNKIGDYYHMISDDVGAHLAWAATFNGEQDVYYTRIGDYDCNGNGVGDSEDLMTGAAKDCNENDIPDSCEIAAGAAPDLNGNGVPDQCECYPDCDQSTGAGVLDIFDFLCFQDAFTSMDPYADCTGDTLFDVFDFLCFQDAFITGCP